MGSIRRPTLAFGAVQDGAGSAVASVELARYVAAVAGEAPSVHNTQPWHFGWGPTHFDVFADRSRLLKRLDPDGRLLTISCGSAVYNAQLAMRGLGWDVSVRLLPSGDNPDHLARLTIEGTDVAAPTAGEWSLLQAIGERGSYRGNFTSRLGAPLLDEMAAAVSGAGCRMYRIERSGQRDEVARLIRSANAALEVDADYYRELAAWRRTDTEARDGIPPSALGLGRAASAGVGFPPRDFALDDRPADAGIVVPIDARSSTSDTRPLAAEPDVLAIWTSRDRSVDWLNAGRALSGLLLTATCGGAAAGLLDQPLEDAPARRRLRAALGVSGPVQLLLRVGFPAGRSEPTPRRDVKDTLT